MSSTPYDALAAIPNACQASPTMVTGGQPTADQLRAFRTAGGAVVLDLRDPMEPRPFDEPALCRELGLAYVNIPVTPGSMDDATLDRILAAVRDANGRQLLFHCGSGARVGASLVPWMLGDQAMDEKDALQLAMRIGVRSPDMLQWGLAYARRAG